MRVFTIRRLSFLILLLTFLCLSKTASAYKTETHELINIAAADISASFASRLEGIGVSIVDEFPSPKYGTNTSVLDLLAEGGVQEDLYGSEVYFGVLPMRARHHFHDPVLAWTDAGWKDQFGHSAVLFALDPDLTYWDPMLDEYVPNTWGWDDALNEFRLALTSTLPETRNIAYGKLFRTLGQLTHLIGDQSVPAHVRDDTHVVGEPYEKYCLNHFKKEDSPIYRSMPAQQVAFDIPSSLFMKSRQLTPNTLSHVSNLWDATIEPGYGSLADYLTHEVGIAEFTNYNFMTKDTMFYNYSHPSRDEIAGHTFEVITDAEYINHTAVYYNRQNSDGTTLNHLARLGLYLEEWELLTEEQQRLYNPLLLDDTCHQEYAEFLIPRAVHYSAALLEYFFRGRFDVAGQGDTVTVTNQSEGQAVGNITVFMEDMTVASDHTRVPVTGLIDKSISLPPGDSTVFQASYPDPAGTVQFIMVFDGNLENSSGGIVDPYDSAISGRVFTWEAPASGLDYKIYHTGNNPKGVAISPDGSTLYVGCQDDDTVEVFETESLSSTYFTTISVGDGPNFMALTPDGSYLFVSNEWGRSISVVETATLSVVQTITGLPSFPQELEVTADGSRLYATSWSWYPVTRVDITSTPPFDVTRFLNWDVHRWGQGLGVNNSKLELYAGYNTFWWSNSLAVLDISTSSDIFDRYIPGNPQTWGVAVESGGKYLYYGISNWYTGKQIRVIDTDNDSEAALFTLTDTPYRLVSDNQGRIFSMWNNSGKVQIYSNAAEAGFIDVNSEHTGCRPLDAAVTADGAGIYVSCPNLGQVRRFPMSLTQQQSMAIMSMTQEVDDSATLILTGVPEGTRAYVEGLFPADWNTDPDTASLTLYGIVPGAHAVRMMAPGYEVYDLTVDLAPYEVSEIPVVLTPSAE